MATKIGDLFFAVSADTTKIYKAVTDINKSWDEAGKIVQKSIAHSFEVAAIAATTALASITVGLAAVGLEFNAAGQRATGLFTALTGSAAEAVDLMTQFAQLSLDAPIFSGKALQDVSRTLLAYGVAKDDVVDLAIAINSTATALGVGELGAHKLALALGQVKARGFFSAEEARQLANYGVNAYGLIAEAVGMTTSEVRELGKQHKLLSEDVLPILIDKLQTTYGPVAQNLINTFGVQVQGLKNIFIGFASALAEPFIGRTGGGAFVEFLSEVRSRLEGVVSVKDGVFQLGGALEGLNTITQALADGFLDLGYSILDAFSGGIGGSGFSSFTQNIADAIPKLVQATKEFASGAIDFFHDLFAAAQPVYEPIKNLVLILADFVVNALPAAADAVVNFVDAAAPIAATLITITDLLAKFASPVTVGVIQDLSGFLADLADTFDALGPFVSTATVAVGLFALSLSGLPGFIAVLTGAAGIAALVTRFVNLAAAIGSVLAAIATYKAVTAGGKGIFGNDAPQNDFLYGDASNPVEGVFQKAARFGRGLTAGSGNVTLENYVHDVDEALKEATVSGNLFAESFRRSGQSNAEFLDTVHASTLGILEQSAAINAYKQILQDVAADEIAKDIAEGIRNAGEAANLFEARVAGAAKGLGDLSIAAEEDIDIMKELKTAAKDAADALDLFLRPTVEATVDDFFRSLQKNIEDVTDAMSMKGGPLKDLALGGALDDAADSARKIINDLVDNYGLSLEEIRALFDKRGLAGVIEAMGNITKETTKAVDPLIAKYGQLGATVEQLRGAVAKLNDQRQTAIKAQIDQVEAALTDAKNAATAARDAIREFFEGPKGSNTQKLIDQLIGNTGDIGSKIEAGLLQGGEQGAAAIRLALGDVQGQLADIVSSGLEDGLSGQQIVDMLGPLGSVLQEQANQALNRISSLDWTEGFTPAAGAEIANLLSSVLDPGAIQNLLNKALGADKTVSGLEKQLEDLKAAAQLDVVFTPEQVQGALDDIAAESPLTVTEIVTTPEAAQAILDVIQGVLSDPTHELNALIDKQLLADQVLSAAEEGAKQTHLIFDSTVAFNEAGLTEAARDAAATFINEFNAQQRAIQDQFAQSQGFADFGAMQAALGPSVAGAITPQVPFLQTVTVTTPVTINGAQDRIATSAEVIAAQSASAGSGGQLSRTLQEIYGYRPAADQGSAR